MGNYLVVCVLSILGGLVGGYFGARWAPVTAQVAILDVQAFVKHETSENTRTEEQAQSLTGRIQKATNPLIEQGIIVIDAQSVVDAPEEAYIHVE